MGITVVDKKYSTRNHPTGNGFALSNAAQIVTDTIDIVESYDFESSMQNQILIVSATSIQVLNASWPELGFSIGDALEFSGTMQNGGNVVEYVNKPFTVIDIQNDLMTLDATLEDPVPQPPQNTSSVVGQLMPAPSGNTSNTTLLIVNTSVAASESIEIFHNLVLNTSLGSDASLFDGEVNRFRANGVISIIPTGTIVMTQLGFKSGGTYLSAILTRLPDVGGKRSYSIEFIYANPYKFEDSDFVEPTQFNGSSSLKPYYRFFALPVSNNPNSFLETTYAVQQGNLGWYDENYNQGPNDFTITSVTITDLSLNTLSEVDYAQENIITVVISGSNTFLKKVEGEIYIIPPINSVSNNINTNGDNISLSNFFIDSTGAPVISTDVFGTGNEQIPTTTQSIATGVNEITVVFHTVPTTEFTALLDSFSDNERLYRISLNVENDSGTSNDNNSVSLIVREGVMEKAPLIGGDFGGLVSQLFHQHNNDVGGIGALPFIGNTEDDALYVATWDFEKDAVWLSATIDTRVTRISDGQFFTLFEQPIPFTNFVTTNDGVIQIDFLLQIQQFLEAPNRNKISLKLNGNETATTYEVDLIWSLFMNWRDWLPQLNAFIDFFDNTLQHNGFNQEYIRYLELAGFTLSTEVTLIDGNNTAFRFGAAIQLTDYDDTTDVTSTVIYFDEDNNPSTTFIQGQTMRIEAKHVNNIGVWNQDDTWAWISIRPFEGEDNKRISTAWDYTTQNLPLKPLAGETKAKISYPSADTAVVECLVDATLLTDNTSVITKIDDRK